MVRQTMVHSNHGVLPISSKEEWTVNIHDNLDDSPDMLWKKSVPKAYILYVPFV